MFNQKIKNNKDLNIKINLMVDNFTTLKTYVIKLNKARQKNDTRKINELIDEAQAVMDHCHTTFGQVVELTAEEAASHIGLDDIFINKMLNFKIEEQEERLIHIMDLEVIIRFVLVKYLGWGGWKTVDSDENPLMISINSFKKRDKMALKNHGFYLQSTLKTLHGLFHTGEDSEKRNDALYDLDVGNTLYALNRVFFDALLDDDINTFVDLKILTNSSLSFFKAFSTLIHRNIPYIGTELELLIDIKDMLEELV